MDKETRSAIERATQKARRILETDFAEQLEGTFEVLLSGVVAPQGGGHLTPRQHAVRERIVASVEHRRTAGEKPAEAVASYLRDAAFTALNRFAALQMIEARGLAQECVRKGEQSSGYREFIGLAPGVALLPGGDGYRLYLECLFDELSTEVKVLFDRRDPASALWPRRAAFEELLGVLNAPELAAVWGEDETIGWVYQYFNSGDERRAMRDASQAPRNSRELAVRNQFFTPRYVVRFLTENTLARIWIEMMGGADGASRIADRCDCLVRDAESRGPRAKKDPRDLKLLDPACGSGHFLLYSFDLFLAIYEEAWADPTAAVSATTGRTLRADYPDLESLRRAAPALILEQNLHGVDIDPRCAQIAALALWLRAQRAWKDAGLPTSQRPRVAKTNIVVAEPMPGDARLVEEFAATLNPPLLRTLFRKMVAEMHLAGELGTLLKIETLLADEIRSANVEYNRQKKTTGYLPGFEPPPAQGELDFSQIDDDTFFDRAEDLLLAALRRFAESAEGGVGVRRRLFAGDAAQGIALVDIVRMKYDVVLMNPPFGECSIAGKEILGVEFSAGANDLYAAFVLRGNQRLAAAGRLGAITSRAFLAGRDQRFFRERLLGTREPHLLLMLDLGAGVLDGAVVETCAFTVGDGPDCVRIGDLRSSTHKASAVTELVVEQGGLRTIPLDRFRDAPQHQILYDLTASQVSSLSGARRVEPYVGRVTKGLSTGDDIRFVRLRWELPPDADEGWQLFSKGGEYGWFIGDCHLLIKRHFEGAELAAFAEQGDGNVARTRQSSSFYGRPGATWSRRSQKGFSARRLRSGVVFSDKSPVVMPEQDEKAWIGTLLGLFATEEYLQLVYAQAKFGSYETGAIKSLPAPERPLERVAQAVEALCAYLDRVEMHDERCQAFVRPLDLDVGAFRVGLEGALADLTRTLADSGYRLAKEVLTAVTGRTMERIADLASNHWRLSFSFGRALDRWVEPGSVNSMGFVEPLGRQPRVQQSGWSSHSLAWLEDDPSSPRDVGRTLSRIGPSEAENVDTIRYRVRHEFFGEHLASYSRGARSAPLYWQLATPSASYSIWLYCHRLTPNTFFHVLQDAVAPKLALEGRRLLSLTQESGPNPTASQRKEIAGQETFVDELRAFRDEVTRVAPLWKPELDDGVLLTMAPLWRLVPQHRAWQKELKAAWDSLCTGEYDWAHVAMHLWPERVVPKCATDRSLAIAHGLEEVFWEEDAKGKWAARKKPLTPVAALVAERTSPAVKAALKDLLEAPVPGGAARATGRGKRRNG